MRHLWFGGGNCDNSAVAFAATWRRTQRTPGVTASVPSRWTERAPLLLALSVVWGAIGFLYRYLSFRDFPNDHFMHLARAQQMLLGEWPTRDFFDPGLPLAYVVSAVPQAIFGQTLLVEAVLVFGSFALAAAVTHWLAARWSHSLWLAGVLTALQILVFPRSYSFPKLLLYPIAALALDRYVATPSSRRLAILAAWTVIAFLMRYDHGLFVGIGFAVGIALTRPSAGWPPALLSVARYVAMVLLLVAPYALYLQWTAGLIAYARDAIAFSRAESRHFPVVLPSFALDTSSALAREKPSATIHVRWPATLGNEDRVRLEQELGLTRDERLGDATWRYRIGDLSPRAIERIVRHPSVEDTSGIDRAAYTVDPERREGSCVLCLRAGAGLHAEENAQAWLYYFAWLTVASGILAGITGGVAPRAMVAALTVMTALASSTFLRTALPVRLADVWGLLPLLLAIAIPAAWLATRWRRILRGATIVTLLITAAAAALVGNAREEMAVARLWEGPAAIIERLQTVTRTLAVTWPDGALPPGPNHQPVVSYLAACTQPSDRILVFSFAPHLYYLTTRGFAAGYSTFVIGAHDSPEAQERALMRWRSQSVPYAVVFEGERELHDSFPLIAAEIERRYTPVFRQPLDDDRIAMVVLAQRGRAPGSIYAPLQAPCLM